MRLLENCKDGSDRDETVNVGAAVQRVEGDNILALTCGVNLYNIFILLKQGT